MGIYSSSVETAPARSVKMFGVQQWVPSGLHRLGAWKYRAHYLAKKMHGRMKVRFIFYLPVFLMKMPVPADANESDKAHGSTYMPDTTATPV